MAKLICSVGEDQLRLYPPSLLSTCLSVGTAYHLRTDGAGSATLGSAPAERRQCRADWTTRALGGRPGPCVTPQRGAARRDTTALSSRVAMLMRRAGPAVPVSPC